MKNNWIAFFIIILVSCNKKPTADFKTNETEYMAGSDVELTNYSDDAKSFKWVLPDGRISNNRNEIYTIPIDMDDSNLSFELTAYSKKGNKSQTVSKSITVDHASGFIVFWKDVTCSCGTVTITIGTQSKQITSNTSTAPVCNAVNSASFYLRIGSYSYSATDGVRFWNGNVSVTRLGCSNVQLT